MATLLVPFAVSALSGYRRKVQNWMFFFRAVLRLSAVDWTLDGKIKRAVLDSYEFDYRYLLLFIAFLTSSACQDSNTKTWVAYLLKSPPQVRGCRLRSWWKNCTMQLWRKTSYNNQQNQNLTFFFQENFAKKTFWKMFVN